VWDLSVEKVAEDHPVAIEILNISAFLAPSMIPSFLFTAAQEELTGALAAVASDELLFAEEVGALANYSLCKIISDDETTALTFHRLVQAATRAKLTTAQTESNSKTALSLLEAEAPPEIIERPDNWIWWYAFMPHVLSAARYGERFTSNGLSAARLLSGAGVYLEVQGRSNEAIPLLKRALNLAQVCYGEDSWEVAVVLDSLSTSLASIGALDEAWKAAQRAKRIVDSLSDKNPRAGAFIVHSALLMRDMGRLQESKDLLSRFMEESSLDDDDKVISSALTTLSAVLFDLGEYDKALRLIEQVMSLVATSGNLDPRVATCLNNLAAPLMRLGKTDQAVECLSKSLIIHQTLYGPRHPLVAGVLSNLGALRRDQGELLEAKKLLELAVEIQEETLGPQSPLTVRVWNNLGAVIRALGDTERAEGIYRRVLASSEEIYGPNNPNVAKVASNLAILLSQDGRPMEARPLAFRAVLIAEHAFGFNHIEVATKLASLGTILLELGENREARQAYRRALAIAKKDINKENPMAVHLQEQLANWE
jgi:tetratricopeptide (TPR) repeat protein